MANPETPATTCKVCGTHQDRIDTEYGAVFVPVTLNATGQCEGCAYKERTVVKTTALEEAMIARYEEMISTEYYYALKGA